MIGRSQNTCQLGSASMGKLGIMNVKVFDFYGSITE
jgi:hypothetical protein